MSITVTFSKEFVDGCDPLNEFESASSVLSTKQLRKPLTPKPHWSARQHKKNWEKSRIASVYRYAEAIEEYAKQLREEIDRDILQAIIRQCYDSSGVPTNILGN